MSTAEKLIELEERINWLEDALEMIASHLGIDLDAATASEPTTDEREEG